MTQREFEEFCDKIENRDVTDRDIMIEFKNDFNKMRDSRDDKESRMAIHYAAIYNRDELLEYLLELDAQIDAQDDEGQTSLHLACSNANGDCVNILLKYKADSEIRDKSGRTCKYYANNDPSVMEKIDEYKTQSNNFGNNNRDEKQYNDCEREINVMRLQMKKLRNSYSHLVINLKKENKITENQYRRLSKQNVDLYNVKLSELTDQAVIEIRKTYQKNQSQLIEAKENKAKLDAKYKSIEYNIKESEEEKNKKISELEKILQDIEDIGLTNPNLQNDLILKSKELEKEIEERKTKLDVLTGEMVDISNQIEDEEFTINEIEELQMAMPYIPPEEKSFLEIGIILFFIIFICVFLLYRQQYFDFSFVIGLKAALFLYHYFQKFK